MALVTAHTYTQAKFTAFVGPVDSGKEGRLEDILNGARDSGYRENGSDKKDDILVVRHPKDDENPEMIGTHKVDLVTENPDEIAELVKPTTELVVFAGMSHYEDPNIVLLTDALVRSGRNVIATALSTDSDGQPYNHLPELLANVDQLELTKGRCGISDCTSRRANRSVKIGKKYVAACAPHHNFLLDPTNPFVNAGELDLYLGSMFSGKSSAARRKADDFRNDGFEVVNFKSLLHVRFGQSKGELFGTGNFTYHNGDTEEAIEILNGGHILEYLHRENLRRDKPGVRHVRIEEGQFIPGIYEAVTELVAKGYTVLCAGLLKGFNRKIWGDMGSLACIADEVEMHYATCVECGHPATNTRRMKKSNGGSPIVAHADDPLELPGGAEESGIKFYYDAACLNHWGLRGEEPSKYATMIPELKRE